MNTAYQSYGFHLFRAYFLINSLKYFDFNFQHNLQYGCHIVSQKTKNFIIRHYASTTGLVDGSHYNAVTSATRNEREEWASGFLSHIIPHAICTPIHGHTKHTSTRNIFLSLTYPVHSTFTLIPFGRIVHEYVCCVYLVLEIYMPLIQRQKFVQRIWI